VPGRLVVVGTGIQLARHLTWEARVEIERSSKFLYLVADPATEEWVRRLNSTAESLADCYVEGESRAVAYAAMVERMLAPVRSGMTVCAAFYGHPGVFVYPSHEAIRRARAEGLEARMLPGISAEDCLFADLGIDPARSGCQSYEATDFLVYQRKIDPTSSLILWQAGFVGRVESRLDGFGDNRPGLGILQEALLAYYPPDHEVVVYEASPFVVVGPSIRPIPLGKLVEADLSPVATLFVPPLPASMSARMLGRLGIDRASLPVARACWEGLPAEGPARPRVVRNAPGT
jgi:uncharacterized protein YabN with tetrapyrrole methylase and pyrophosphatase domain